MRRTPNVDTHQTPPVGGAITAIIASPRVPGRYAVIIGGRAAHTLGLAAIERFNLSVGASTVGREEAIAREEGLLRTYDRAVMMLAARGRAAKDLERQLIRKGEPPDQARLAVERLRAEGFIDDEAYARSFVRSKSAGPGLARFRLKQELGRQGVERGVADEAIAEVFEEEAVDELATASALATKRARSLRGVDSQAQRRRLYSFLARRGYSPSIIAAAIAAATGSSDASQVAIDD